MQVIISSPPPQQMAVSLDSLLDPNVPDGICPRRARQQIDLILLAIEALDLGGSEAILWSSRELELQDIIKNRVVAWKLRATNPMRRNSQRQPLSLTEAKALVMIICHLAEQLATVIRQLLLAYEQLTEKQLSLDHSPRLANYLERFRAHFRSRMNPKRSTVMTYDDEKLNQLALNLLSQLLFYAGTAGTQRLWNSLFDGEVA